MSRFIDLTGQRFGRLIVIRRDSESQCKETYFLCKCDCGELRSIRATRLRNGSTLSCGCLRRETCQSRATTHGQRRTRLYTIWAGMKNRCRNPSHPSFAYYGARGIKVCEAWASSFETFHTWAVNNGYSDNLSIDRIDSDGDYSPENCRWSTSAMQMKNRRPWKKTNHK